MNSYNDVLLLEQNKNSLIGMKKSDIIKKYKVNMYLLSNYLRKNKIPYSRACCKVTNQKLVDDLKRYCLFEVAIRNGLCANEILRRIGDIKNIEIPDDLLIDSIKRVYTHNNEYIVNLKEHEVNKNTNKKFYSLDFKYHNKIIEYDGHYHDKVKDNARDLILMNRGYEVFRVDDTEYRKDKEDMLMQCLEFLCLNT